jgi:phosphatidylinositol alpha-1,6-mannosyltransferase
MPARLALLTLDYPPERGGVARYLGNLIDASNGEMAVFVNETHPTVGPGSVTATKLVWKDWPHWWPMVGCIRRLAKQGVTAVLVSHVLPVGTAAWIASWFGGPAYAVLVHGLDMRLAAATPWKKRLAAWVLKRASLVVANSEFTAQEARAFAPGVEPLVLTPGVETLMFPEKMAARALLRVPAPQKVVLSVARLVPRKGIDRLIEAVKALPDDVLLAVVGDGEDLSRLKELAAPLADRVRFVTDASDETRNAWYAAADVFALPVREETGDVEGFGIVYLEAALAGLPSIAGRSGGAAEAVVDGETGYVVEDEVRAVAAMLQTLLQDPMLRLKLGAAAKERAKSKFRWADRWEALKAKLS